MAELLAETGVDDADGRIVIPPARSETPPAEADHGPAPALPTVVAEALPTPYDAHATTGELSDRERADLQVCEAAIDNLRHAFWAAGKALAVIQRGELYRPRYATFEAYVTERWDMRTSQAYRLIKAWPIAEALSPIGDKINEAQVRELIPIADKHGQDAAVTVYSAVTEAVAQVDGGRVTAAVLGEVVRILPTDQFDPAKAVEQIRAYLAGTGQQPAAAPVDPAQAWATERERLRTTVRRAVMRPAVRSVLRERPDEARTVAAELRELAAEIEREAMTERTDGT